MRWTRQSATKRSAITIGVAIFLTLIYIGASLFLLFCFAADNSLPETSWQRALIIYNGIASVGFAAIGVLLGTSVQQVAVAAAKQDSAKKTEAIKAAAEKLTGAPAGKPGDLGGGPSSEETRISEAHRMLLKALN